MAAAPHVYPRAPLAGHHADPSFCTAKKPCEMLAIAIAGSHGSDVGLHEHQVFDSNMGFTSPVALRVRVANPTHKSRKKFLSLFIVNCPFCGKKAPKRS